jgi:choline dehydrogenase-like flavoprotein
MAIVAKYPDSTKTSLEQRLRARARERWPQITGLHIRHRGTFSYVDATLTDATSLKLCRLRYVGSASQWQFAIYRASHDDYDESVFPTGLPIGTCQQALDTACGLYLNDPTAWT